MEEATNRAAEPEQTPNDAAQPNEPQPQTRTARLRREHRRNNRALWFICAIGAFVLCVLFFALALPPLYIANASMSPTLETGETVLVDRVSKFVRYFERGDVVAFRHPVTGEMQVRRVLALPGETVRILTGAVIINDKYVVDETDYATAVVQDTDAVDVPEGYVYVLSDDRAYGDDSRDDAVGLVPVEGVYGVVRVRLNRFAVLR